MTELYNKAFNFMLENEGGFSNHSQDKGGATLYGVSSKFFPQVYEDLQKAQDENEIKQILYNFYHNEFWNPLYNKINEERLAVRLFDLGVNMGKKTSVRLLQSASNVLGSSLKTDGVFGNGTLTAINVTKPYNEYIRQAESYYKGLSDFNIFGRGWINRLYREI